MSTEDRWGRFRLSEEDARRVAAIALSSIVFALLPLAARFSSPRLDGDPAPLCKEVASRSDEIRCDTSGAALDGTELLLAGVKIDLNRASEDDLKLLPEIGPAIASRIIADRVANGPFCSASDLTRVRGIGAKRAARIAPFTRPSPTPAPPCK